MLLLFQATATQLADSTQIVADKLMEEAIANADGLDKLSLITQQLVDFGIRAGERILIATLVFIVGRFLISMLNRFVGRLMDRRKVDISIKTFVKSSGKYSADHSVDYLRSRCSGSSKQLLLQPCWLLPVWLSVWRCPVTCRTLPAD